MLGYSSSAAPVAPLPEGWTESLDAGSGNKFYHNASLGETTWDRPAPQPPVMLATHYPLPDGWTEHSDETGNVFYHCLATGETKWERPIPGPPEAVSPVQSAPEGPPGLPGAFLGYLKKHPEVLDSIREYQTRHRQLFLAQVGEEYSLETKNSYDAFVFLIDSHLNAFLLEQGATADMFAEGLLDMKRNNDPHFMAFDLLLRKVDFPTLAGLMRSNTCLCCGGIFMGT